jgi:branched-chain amino acid aminotransferase
MADRTDLASASGGVWSDGAAYIDGGYCPIDEAKISVLDWGLTRSDCTYDVVHVWEGRFFRLETHLDRFLRGLGRLHLELPHDRSELQAILAECVRRSGLREAYVSMTCTRGRPPAGSRELRACVNNFYCFAIPFVWITTPEQQQTGVSLYVSDIPRIAPESVDPTVKNYHWMDMEMALWEANEHGAPLVVLRDGDGNISEGPGYNVFALHDGRWLTPGGGTLEGVTRGTVIELCGELGVPVEAGALTAEVLRSADEVIATSTAGGVMPVTAVDGEPVGEGRPGVESMRLHALYWAKHADPAWSTAVDYG